MNERSGIPPTGVPSSAASRSSTVPSSGTSMSSVLAPARSRRPAKRRIVNRMVARKPRLALVEPSLTHLDAEGTARMVDISAKTATERWARARAVVRMSPETAVRVVAGDMPKGDVVAVARIAAIQAAKRTAELIPLCHQLPLSHVDCDLCIDVDTGTVTLTSEARTVHGTGVEMEALTAASVGALTVYDMVKGVEKGVTIEHVALLDKTGGKSGDWHR